MSCQELRNFAEAVVDSLKFAAEGGCMSGKLPLSSLPRLSDVLICREDWLECEVSGDCVTDAGGQRKFFLHLRVSGRLSLQCQRCLSDVSFECAVDRRLLLVPEGAVWPEDELEVDEYDALPASREQSVLELVEEEVLLALPIAPCHEDCVPPADAGSRNENSGLSPFAALAGLKKH